MSSYIGLTYAQIVKDPVASRDFSRACNKAKCRKYYAKNKDVRLAKSRAYNEKNKEALKSKAKERYEKK